MAFVKNKSVVALALLLAATGCKDFFDVNTDPLNPTSAQLKDLLPVTQVALGTNLGMSALGVGQATSTLTGQYASTRDVGSYSVDGASFVNQWDGLYTDVLANNELIIQQGTQQQAWAYVGIAQLQKAYAFSILVDLWGPVPYSEALQGAANQAPRFDRDIDIYLGNDQGIQSLFALIDEGLVNLSRASSLNPGGDDLMYGGTAGLDKWRRFGNSLKLKLYNQIRKVNDPRVGDLASRVRATLSQPLLRNLQDDFELKYNASSNPDNRNLGYLADYPNSGRENFIGPYFWRLMTGINTFNTNANPAPNDAPPALRSVSGQDPRTPYYFFNQKTSTSIENIPYQSGRFVTVPIGSLSTSASAANSNIRTLPGLYPVGGAYDKGRGAVGGAADTTARGVVAQRLLTYAAQQFTVAEAQLTILNDPAAAASALALAEAAAYAKVNDIAAAEGAPLIPGDTVTARVGRLIRAFNVANPQGKLRIIITQKYIANFGTGYDVYTDYRRTGFPEVPQPGVEPQTRLDNAYPRIFPYSADDIQSNPNHEPQHNPYQARVFWDK